MLEDSEYKSYTIEAQNMKFRVLRIITALVGARFKGKTGQFLSFTFPYQVPYLVSMLIVYMTRNRTGS